MAVLPKRFDKRGRAEDYIGYMTDRIEYWAQINDKKVNELTEKNKALEKELAEIKQILMSGGFYGNV
jgi:uncharacterized protein YdeI (YjbR/CyaY-like superfamily)